MENEKLEIIKMMKQKISKQYTILEDLKYKLKLEEQDLKDICIHNYIKESDGDYHKAKYYFLCNKCNHIKNEKVNI